MIYCWSAIVSIAISRTTFELFDVEKHRDFEIWVNGHSRSLKMVPFQNLGTVSCSRSVVTTVVSCIVSGIKLDVGRRKSRFSYPLHSPSEFCHNVFTGKLEWLLDVKKGNNMFSRFDRIPACNRSTDRRTDGHRHF